MKPLLRLNVLLLSASLFGCASSPVKVVPLPVEMEKEPTKLIEEVKPKPTGYFLIEIQNALEK